MSTALNALMTKLNWQLNDLNEHLALAHAESLRMEQQITELEQQINQSCFSPVIINPEFEINRLNFITQEQTKLALLTSHLKENQDLETKLNAKIMRVKTELKMLEKYLQRETLFQHSEQQKIQSNALDEWVIQKRKTV